MEQKLEKLKTKISFLEGVDGIKKSFTILETQAILRDFTVQKLLFKNAS